MGAIGARGHRHVPVLVCLVSTCAVVSGTISVVPLDWGLFPGEDQLARRICRLGRGVYRTVLLCGMVRGVAIGSALCGFATAHSAANVFSHLLPLTPHLYTKSVARCCDVVADGGYQCLIVATCGCRIGIGLSLYPSGEVPVMDRYPDSAYRLLDDRTSGMAICHHKGDSNRMEALVVGRLAGGSTTDGVCVAAATMAVAAGDDWTELLSDSVAVSTMERIR